MTPCPVEHWRAGTAVEEMPGRPVLIEPGELLAFSAAHLHAGAADASGDCRISIDTRTVWNGDLAAGRGAPNVDGATPGQHWEWFRRPKPSPEPECAPHANHDRSTTQ